MDAVVTFDYDKQQDDELTLRAGEILVNVNHVEEGWCQGTLNGVTGMFPDNFVELKPAGSLSRPSAPAASRAPSEVTAKRERRARVAFSYAAESIDEISLDPGQVVVVLEEVEEGWWKGSINGKIGVFPSNFVEEIEEDEVDNPAANVSSPPQPKPQEHPSDGSRRTAPMVNVMPDRIGVDPNELKQKLKSVHTPTTTNEPPSRPPPPPVEKSQPAPPPSQPLPFSPSSSSSSLLRKAKVLYPYDAENPDEVTVTEGEVLVVLQFAEETGQEGWWKVRSPGGKEGFVPDNFVELLPTPAAQPPQPDKPVPSQPDKPAPPQPFKPAAPAPLPEKTMPGLPPKVPKASEPSAEPVKHPPIGGVRLMPAGLPVKSKSAVPLPTLPPKVDTPPTKVETTKTEPPKKNEPVNVGFGGSGGDSGGGGVDLDIPRSDLLDNRKVKDRPKMNSRRPPSRSSLHGGEEDTEGPGESGPSPASSQPGVPAKPSPPMSRAPWQQEMMERKKKPPPPLKQKPKPKAKPVPGVSTTDKEEEPKKSVAPTPSSTPAPPPSSASAPPPTAATHPPPPATATKPSTAAPSKVNSVSDVRSDQKEEDSGRWKEAFEKLREEFNTFRKQMRNEMKDLVDDLDRERKKRAEMEIDIDRLKRLRDKH